MILRFIGRLAAATAIACFISLPVRAERVSIDLTGNDWGIWRDRAAEWVDDDIHLPPVDMSSLPVKPPSCGWENLSGLFEKTVRLPATIEEHFWGGNGNHEGVAGDYRGVSWWVTTVRLGPEIEGKQVFLDFQSVHLRAEVFVNRTLCGYDVIGHTPFRVDITGAVRPGVNEIAVRITDPLGNFNWNDRRVLKWGGHDIPAMHGFGGITGDVLLRAVDSVFIEDVAVFNRADITSADILVEMENRATGEVTGELEITVRPSDRSSPLLKETKNITVKPGVTTFEHRISADDAEPWTLDNPVLHIAEIRFRSDGGGHTDTAARRFGFRWFDVGEGNGDRRLYLNGRRIVLRGAMTWCFWPVNGVYPTREMAERDVEVAKELGLTYMNFHRAIGQPLAMDVADERGFLTYEEPGGYSCEGADPDQTLWREWRRIKLMRMVRRDRSHPSLIMYNLQNRTPNPLTPEDRENMLAAHEIDPTRIFTFISGFWEPPEKHQPEKLFLAPNDFNVVDTGWHDMHNHTREHGWSDDFYNGPRDYLRYTGIADEIVFWGEDGGLFSPPRLQKIKAWHDARPEVPQGWMVRRFLDWWKAFDSFLDENGFRRFFPTVDDFTRAMGTTTLDYHGRVIENIRAGNLDDAYTINGWAAPHLVNQSEAADLYRNPSGDPAAIARYCRPLYVAVKLRNTVAPAGSEITADFFLVNEENLRGSHTLTITMDGGPGFERSFSVDVTGGEEYGQLLAEGVPIPLPRRHGPYTVRAVLTDTDGIRRADGSDTVFVVSLEGVEPAGRGALIDGSGVIGAFMKEQWGTVPPAFDESMTGLDYVVVGENDFNRSSHIGPLMNCVANGAVAVVLDGADRFAQFLTDENMQAVDYRGAYPCPRGKFCAGNHALLDGLPRNTGFGKEYQCFYRRPGGSIGALRLRGVETIVAAINGNDMDVGTALCVVPYGRGAVILCSLSVLPGLSSEEPHEMTAKRLFANCIEFAGSYGER